MLEVLKENKKYIIIAIGVIAVLLLGVGLYFLSKNKRLMNHIDDLKERVDELEDVVQKFEKTNKNNLKNTQIPPQPPHLNTSFNNVPINSNNIPIPGIPPIAENLFNMMNPLFSNFNEQSR